HSAQKSTSTGPSAPNTSVAKLWSVTVLVAMAIESPSAKRLTAIWAFGRCLSRHQFDEFWCSGVKQGGPHFSAGKDHAQCIGVGNHLCAMRGGDVGITCRYASRLEVDHGDSVLLDEQAIHRASNDSPIGQRCSQGCLAERPRPKQLGEPWIGEDSAHLIRDLGSRFRIIDAGRAFEPLPRCSMPPVRFNANQTLKQLMNQCATPSGVAHRLAR